jgi:hypothetical protein
MFLNIIKNFLLKNKVSKLLSNSPANQTEGLIKSVGVIFDGNLTLDIENVIHQLIKHGIEENQIKVLIFKNKINKNEVYNHEVFTYKEINLSGEITNPKAELFLKTKFDLLINYHEFDKMPLVYSSYLSNANFKVGFTSKDKIVNQFMINTSLENYQLFLDELFKYLKILNKI